MIINNGYYIIQKIVLKVCLGTDSGGVENTGKDCFHVYKNQKSLCFSKMLRQFLITALKFSYKSTTSVIVFFCFATVGREFVLWYKSNFNGQKYFHRFNERNPSHDDWIYFVNIYVPYNSHFQRTSLLINIRIYLKKILHHP